MTRERRTYVEKIHRKDSDQAYEFDLPPKLARPHYPWQLALSSPYPPITKEFFRCQGSYFNPERFEGDKVLEDCGGVDAHSLPLYDGKEFIFPILISLLNTIQAETGKRVVITSGHRCPVHNAYIDITHEAKTSKHMIGAEVSFYVEGMETTPEKILPIIFNYYAGRDPDYVSFNRYEKRDTNVSTPPWFNKEIFVKLFRKEEGRNLDNQHPYPYLSIQVRYDPVTKQRIHYSWARAHQKLMRR